MLKKDEARKVDAKTSPAQTSMDSAVKPNKSKNYNTQYFDLARYLADQKVGFECITYREEVLGAMLVHISKAEKFAVVTKDSVFPGQEY